MPGDATDGNPLAADLRALRNDAAVAARPERALLVVTGADRGSFLQGMLSNEVAKLVPGQGSRALLLNEQGRIVGELGVMVAQEEILLDVARQARPRVRAALERFVVADDVEFDEPATCAVALLGLRAAEVLARAVADDAEGTFSARLARLAPGGHVVLEVAGVPARVVRRGVDPADGFALWTDDASCCDELIGRLADRGARPVGPGALEAGRIADGIALEGVDFDETTLAAEVPSLAHAISYRKGCYLGQEVVERVAARGHVNWLVVGLRAPVGGTILRGAAVRQGDREVGRISSAICLPSEQGVVMLARIRRESAEPGTALAIETESGPIEAAVAGRPEAT
jgi:folate-binding protein YgfZ